MPDLSDSVNWSETDANNNQAPPNGWPEGMMPSGVNDAARADRGAMKRFWDKINPVQQITPSGNLWTFTTSNTAYPTAYVDGEIYSFFPIGPSVGGDYFQINSLPSKPIYKHIAPGGYPGPTWVPIAAQDIVGAVAVQLIYWDSHDLFVLLNPHSPVTSDGVGGAILSSGILVNRDGGAVRPTVLTAIRTIGAPQEQPAWFNDSYAGPGSLIALRYANGSNAAPTPLVAGNTIGAYSFRGWDSLSATDFTAGTARIIARATETWSSNAHGTQLEIDTCNNLSTTMSSQAIFGPGLTLGAPTAPSGGMLTGDINAQRVFCQGQLVAVTSSDGSSNVSGNATVGGTLTVTGQTGLQSDLTVNGTQTFNGPGVFNTGTYITGIFPGGTPGGETLFVNGSGYFAGGLEVNGALQTNAALTVVGDSTFQNGLTISAGGLGVTGNVGFNNNLTVVGNTSFESGVNITTGGLGVTGDTGITGNVTIVGNLSVSGTHPLTATIEELTARVASLEAAVEVLRDQVRALQG